MSVSLEEVQEIISGLSPEDRAQLFSHFLMEMVARTQGAFPGIESQSGICGGAPRIVRTRIPVWTLEAARRQGLSEDDLLKAFPSLRAEDLVYAWAYVEANRGSIDQQIAENEAA